MTAAAKIAEARALIEPLTGATPGPWQVLDGMAAATVCPAENYDAFMTGALVHGNLRIVHDGDPRDPQCVSDARLIAAAPALRDTVAALADLADALAQENAKLRSALEQIAAQHMPSEPMHWGGTEYDWACRQYGALRSIACDALGDTP